MLILFVSSGEALENFPEIKKEKLKGKYFSKIFEKN